MQVTLLGHASLVVESDGTTVYMDPVFSDPFQGDLVVSCPRREVFPDALPRPDALVISHSHLDHFHAPTLSRLPRDIPVYVPRDSELVRALTRLGFQDVHALAAGDLVQLRGLSLTSTGSAGPGPEMGVLFTSPGASVWNQVDTVVTQRTCVEVLEQLDGNLDVAFCAYRPLLEYAGMWTDEVSFPRDRYERLLEMAVCCRARTVIPGSCGLRAADRLDWVNHRLFPASRDQFCQDLAVLAPDVKTLQVNPGEALVVSDGGVRRHATPYARTVDMDEYRTEFDPERHAPPALHDPNIHAHPEGAMDDAVERVMAETVPAALAQLLDWRLKGPLRRLWDRRAIFQVDIVFPSGTRSWHVAAWNPLRFPAGAHGAPDYTWSYRASEIYGLLRGEPVEPTVMARRRRDGAAYHGRLGVLDPARLHGVDLNLVVDETFDWNPLGALVE
ncbi:MAG: MBL fold metallo-hydrolase [Deltaproteobacteria bacterium]|nr:MBL fold metallo-hydrolase [Deltaproteobacteria bacterium]